MPQARKRSGGARTAEAGDKSQSAAKKSVKKSNYIKVTEGYQEGPQLSAENNGGTSAVNSSNMSKATATAESTVNGFPEVYTVPPRQSKKKKTPGQLTATQVRQYFEDGFKDLWSNERTLNMMEQLLGPEVAGNPVWNLRCKTPFNALADLPWHQDNAFLDEDALQSLIPSLWIPLLDVNAHNGTLQVVRGGHRCGKTATHTCCSGGTWYVEMADEEMENTLGVNMSQDIVTCEFEYGGAVLFSNTIPHRSLVNQSDKIRWALDFRYMQPGKPVGLWGIKESVLMRTRKVKNFKINWEDFEKVNRTDGQKKTYQATDSEHAGRSDGDHSEDEFDTTLSGPWMHRWELTNHNRHTATLTDKQQDEFTHKA